MIKLVDKSGPWMRTRILQDAYKLAKTLEKEDDSITSNDLNFALAIIACRYSSLQWRMKAKEVLEERLKGTPVDPLFDEQNYTKTLNMIEDV